MAEEANLTEAEQIVADQAAEAQQIIAEQADMIAKLSAENTALKGAPDAVPMFSHGDHTYAVGMAKFIYLGQEYTAQQLLDDEALQAELIEKGVGYISRLNHALTEAE